MIVLVGMIDGRGNDGQQKDVICDIRGLCQMIQSIFKPLFLLISTDWLQLRVAQMQHTEATPGIMCRGSLCIQSLSFHTNKNSHIHEGVLSILLDSHALAHSLNHTTKYDKKCVHPMCIVDISCA